MIYFELYHGHPFGDATNPHPRLIGPTFKADRFVSTYGWPRLIIDGENEEFDHHENCICYDGVLYGDFAVTSEPPPEANLQPFDPSKATLPDQLRKEAQR